jgi:hypothetical protein
VASNDVEIVQSFIRKYINKAIKEHFNDIPGDDEDSLSKAAPRSAIKLVCLHKDTDPITLTAIRLLIWWVEARGLLDEFIYGIPSTDFEIKHTYYPQVKLHFREDKIEAFNGNRRPARGEISFRWKEENYTEANILALTNKIIADFARPPFHYQRGRELWSYADKQKGYYFQMTVQSEAEAKKVIKQVIGIQDSEEPDWEKYLREHKDQKNYTIQETVRVMGQTVKKPKKRPIAKIEFKYAELFIPGTTKPLILVDRSGTKAHALKIV